MNAKELRIGNFIKSVDRIDGPFGGAISAHWEVMIDDMLYVFNNANNYEPILLTEEWLIKFNFTKGIDKVYFIKTKNGYLKVFEKIAHVLISTDKYSNCFKISDNIKYVHQLQNLYFALTGKELLIIK